MQPTFYTRADAGLGAVPVNNDGYTPRRPHQYPLKYLTRHYTGVPRYLSNGNERYPATMDVAAFLRNLQSVAIAAGKSYEYSIVIPPTIDPQVWEYAGDYVAAHSAGENTIAYGVLFVNGVDQPLTEGQIVAYRWWRDVLLAVGKLETADFQYSHREMPGALTLCAGAAIELARSQLLLPYQPAPEEDDMPPTQIVIDTRLNGTFACVSGRWVPWLDAVPKGVPTFKGDHPWTREQILHDQGPTAAQLWRERMGK